MAPSIATNTDVELDQLLDFVRPRHRMVLMTRRPTARRRRRPSPAGSTTAAGSSSRPTRSGPRPERPQATRRSRSLVLSDEWDDAWVQVDGTCEVLDATDGDEALDAFVEYFRTIAGEHSDWDEYRSGHGRAGQVAAADHAHPVEHRLHRRLPARGGRALLTSCRPLSPWRACRRGRDSSRSAATRGSRQRWSPARSSSCCGCSRSSTPHRATPSTRTASSPAARTASSGSSWRRCSTSASGTWSATPSRSRSSAS